MKRIPRLSKGGILTPQQWDGVASVLESNFREVTLQPGDGYYLKNGTGGQTLQIVQNQTAQNNRLPFEISKRTSDTGVTKLSIWPGTINQIIPENYEDLFDIDETSQWYVKAVCSSDGEVINSVTIVVDTNSPDIQIPATDAMPYAVDVLLGAYKSGQKYNVVSKSINLVPTQVFQADGHFSGLWV